MNRNQCTQNEIYDLKKNNNEIIEIKILLLSLAKDILKHC